jgi:parvulin-like peptidyl-prolyl isomerase
MSWKHSRHAVMGGAAVLVPALGMLVYWTWGNSTGSSDGGGEGEAAAAVRRAPPSRYQALPSVLATVGSHEIRKEDLTAALDIDEYDRAAGDEANDQFYEAVVWGAVRGEVLRQVLVPEARRRGIQLTEEDRKKIDMSSDQRDMFNIMAPQIGMSPDEMLQRVEEALLIERMMIQDFIEIETVSEDAIVAEYEVATDDYYTEDVYRARHIYLQRAEGETDGDFVGRVQTLSRELRTPGADFARTAMQLSEAEDASTGGLLDDFGMSDPPLKDGMVLQTLLQMQPGQVSNPVPRGDGFEILLLEERVPPQRMTLEQARPQILLRLQSRKAKPKLQAWIRQMEQQAGVVIRVPEPAIVRMRRQQRQ